MLHQMNHCPRTRPRPRSMTHVPLSPMPFRLPPVNAAVCRRIEPPRADIQCRTRSASSEITSASLPGANTFAAWPCLPRTTRSACGSVRSSASSRSPKWAGLRSPPSSTIGTVIFAYASRRLPSWSIAAQSSIWCGASRRIRGESGTISLVSSAVQAGTRTMSRTKIASAVPGLPASIAARARVSALPPSGGPITHDERGAPVDFPLDGVVPGFQKAIAGQKVGSTVAVAMTSADGYPDGQPSAGIQPGDTLVFAIKILGASS
jgi:hypothetical protein